MITDEISKFSIRINNEADYHYLCDKLNIDDKDRYPFESYYKYMFWNTDIDICTWDLCGENNSYLNGLIRVSIDQFLKMENKKLNKIMNLDDDPFGEENYGFVQENLDLDDFQINDIVIINNDILKELSDSEIRYLGRSGGGDGRIYAINKTSYPIAIRWDNGNSGSYRAIEVLKIKRGGRRLNLEEDPLGEENWGYVQENLKNNTFKFIPIDKYYEFNKDVNKYLNFIKKSVNGKYVQFVSANNSMEKIIHGQVEEVIKYFDRDDIPTESKHGMGIKLKVDGLYHFIHIFKPIIVRNKKLKKITNFEDDPFGEDNWGYVQEKIEYQESFTIIEKYSEFRNDENRVLEFMKKELVGKKIEFSAAVSDYKYPYKRLRRKITDIEIVRGKPNDPNYLGFNFISKNEEWRVNVTENIRYNKGKRILNMEDDPFGEENYYVVEKENNKNTMITKFKLFEEVTAKTYEMTGPPPKRLWSTKSVFEEEMSKLGYTHTTLTKNTSMLVCAKDDLGTAKYQKALKYGTPIYTYEEAWRKFSKKLIKIRNWDDDPFGEEDYGYIEVDPAD